MNYSQIRPLDFTGELFPLRRGKYEISPGLSPLDSDIFLRDESFDAYIEQKKLCFKENKDKYLCLDKDFLSKEDIYQTFLNKCSNKQYQSISEMCLDVQEDFALMKGEKAIAISLCFPNHWDPNDKISQNFNHIHIPVADFGPIAKNATRITHSLIERGPFKRFAWGLSTDTRLNHHPIAPDEVSHDDWYGRSFKNDGKHKLYMRVERQHMVGLPEEDLYLFTIRTYFLDIAQIPVGELKLLKDAILSMTPETLSYKGIKDNLDQVIAYLDMLIS